MAVKGRDIVIVSQSPTMTPLLMLARDGEMHDGGDCVAGRAPGGSTQPSQTSYEDVPLRRSVHSQDIVSRLMAGTH
jgi:hypothetical protein